MEIPMEAAYAREEINKTNRTHTPWINVWAIMCAVFYAAWLLTGKSQFRVLVPYAVLPMLGLMIRAEALVRRHWTLYVQLSKQAEITPDATSRGFVLIGNIYGLLFAAIVLVLNALDSWSSVHDFTWWMIEGASLLIVLGLVVFWMAGQHKPKFE